jgi:hypothetical protein
MDSTSEVQIGTVIEWTDFPFPRFGSKKIKTRWFVCVGHTGELDKILGSTACLYISTTTTMPQRLVSTDRYFSFSPDDFSPGDFPFEQACCLDYDEEPNVIPENVISGSPDIRSVSVLDKKLIKVILKGLLTSDEISKRVKDVLTRSLDEIDHMIRME